MKVLLVFIAALHAVKLTQTLDHTQVNFDHQIADLLVGLNYDSKRQTQRKNKVTRPSNRRFGMKRKLSSQRRARANRSKQALTQRRSAIDSLVTYRQASKRNQIDENRIISSMFLV